MEPDYIYKTIDNFFPFEKYREGQRDIIFSICDAIINKNKKNIILDAPTGTGKSVICYTASMVLKHLLYSSYLRPLISVCTSSKLLQKQYEDSFNEILNIKSSKSYPCPLYDRLIDATYRKIEEVDVDVINSCIDHKSLIIDKKVREIPADNFYYGSAYCKKSDCNISSCEYRDIVTRLRVDNRLVSTVTNYYFYASSNKFTCFSTSKHKIDTESGRGVFISIFDECHNIEKVLVDAYSIQLSEEALYQAYELLVMGILDNALFFSDDEAVSKILSILNTNVTFKKEGEVITLDNYNDIITSGYARLQKLLSNILDNYENLDLDIPKHRRIILGYRHFSSSIYQSLLDIYEIKDTYSFDHTTLKAISQIGFLNIDRRYSMLSYFEDNKDIKWVVSYDKYSMEKKENREIILKPLYVKDIMSDFLSDINIFTSATVCGHETLAESLNLTNYEYISTPMTFPVENRFVYINNKLPGLNYRNRNEVLPKYVKEIDTILTDIKSQDFPFRGLIHSISYSNAEYIKENSAFSDIMHIPKGENVKDFYNYVTTLGDEYIILHPAMTEGVDLAGDLSNFQILLKVPYPFLGDPWVKERLDQSQSWYARETIVSIVQACGRSVRSEDDKAYTYILDGHNFNKLYNNHNNLFPDWFKESIKF